MNIFKFMKGAKMLSVSKTLIIIGIIFIVCGALLWLLAKSGVPLGKLPGDFIYKGKNFTLAIPIISCLLVSVILTLILNIFFRD